MATNRIDRMKRCFDVAAAAAGCIVLSPFFLIISLFVWLSSEGPVIFRQRRVGRNGTDFIMFKFRTMRVAEGAEEGRFDAGDLSRTTKTGRILRRYKLDELPQLWNVLKGDMSMVGPRPEIRYWVDRYPEKWAAILVVRPGITDPASMMFRHEEELLAASKDPRKLYGDIILPKKLELYESYVHSYTVLSDIMLIVQTLFAVFAGVKDESKE
jgi:lipopolysaccharide/colanic/teichoic acid biosynthesis glycosyltransferase